MHPTEYGILEQNGKRFVLVPVEIYHKLQTQLHNADNTDYYESLLDDIDAGIEETLPSVFAKAVLQANHSGEVITLWRKRRKLSRAALAKAVGVTSQYIAMIEQNKRKGDIDVIKRIADTLNVLIDDLMV